MVKILILLNNKVVESLHSIIYLIIIISINIKFILHLGISIFINDSVLYIWYII